MKHIEILQELDACDEAVEWAKGYESLEHAWNECKHSDWMLWLDRKMDLFTDKQRRLMACRFVRETPIGEGKTVWDLLTDERSRNAVVVSERYANGEATVDELSTASDAAKTASSAAASGARDASAADGAAWAAAWAAWDAWDAWAAWAAWAAAWAAWDATSSAAKDYARAVQCDIIRSYGNPFNENNKKGE